MDHEGERLLDLEDEVRSLRRAVRRVGYMLDLVEAEIEAFRAEAGLPPRPGRAVDTEPEGQDSRRGARVSPRGVVQDRRGAVIAAEIANLMRGDPGKPQRRDVREPPKPPKPPR